VSEHADAFVQYLKTLKERDRGALATLRHSLAFEPGTYPKAFPFVERFAGAAAHERDARRVALYAVAGLFAAHPFQEAKSLATALGQLMRVRGSPSLEQRFIALLGADAENVHHYLRQVVSLLAADGLGCDYSRLLDDLTYWMRPGSDPARIRQRWARDFYRAAQAEITTEDPA
jgi:CRISPR system Cascade subunit CasB